MGKKQKTIRDRSQQAEYAVRYIIDDYRATYAEVARLFELPVAAIRSRIENRFGSLAAARDSNSVRPGPNRKQPRTCFICKTKSKMHKNQRICEPCRRKINSVHDGYV